MEGTMKALNGSKSDPVRPVSEHDVNLLMRKHTLEREACEERWSNELNQLRDSQRREYRDWVTKVYQEMQSHDPKPRST